MPVDEFLARSNMANEVAKASKQKAEGIHSGMRVVIMKRAGTVKADFVGNRGQSSGSPAVPSE